MAVDKSKLTKEERAALTSVLNALGVWAAATIALAMTYGKDNDTLQDSAADNLADASKKLVDQLDAAGKV